MNPDAFLRALIHSSLAASVLVLLVIAAQSIFRKQLAPHWQCALWLLVAARLLPISFTSEVSLFNLLPKVTAPDGARASLYELVTLPLRSHQPAPNATTAGVVSASPAISASDNASDGTWDAPTLAFLLWLAGALLLGVHVVGSSLGLARRLRRARPIEDYAIRELLRACSDAMGVRHPPRLLESSAIDTPALHGIFRPRLLLPAGFREMFSAAELRFVLLHELAHLRRRDLLLNWLMTALQLLHWFNPLVWFAFARWRVDREIACDAAALEIAGKTQARDYGRAILRLLENVATPVRRPGLVGILEDKRQLGRRIRMIAAFQPGRRPFVAAGLLVALALVGLTDAQTPPSATAPASVPAPAEKSSAAFVLFLVNGSETMLTDPSDTRSGESLERGRPYAPGRYAGIDAEMKRANPNWQRTVQIVEHMLTNLPAETSFRVALFHDDQIEHLGDRGDASNQQAIPSVMARLRSAVPRGAANLESAFAFAADTFRDRPPERIVLITHGLPTTGIGSRSTGEVTEAERIRCYQLATKRLPPRVPVHTVLLPGMSGDPGAPGLYWELANATRGGLTVPAPPSAEPRTHVAFVIDTSGSMRDPNHGGLWPIVIDTIEATLDAHPHLVGLQVLDGDGRFILGRRGTGLTGWLPNTPETRDAIRRVLRRYAQDTVSNPVPGIAQAMRHLFDKNAPDMRMGIYVFGDEYNSSDPASVTLDRIRKLNPADATGRRAITINAIGFPTTIRYQFSMGNTGLRFANLMRILAHEHDGAFIAMPEL